MEARNAIASAKESFDRISFDFIYAWPGQKECSWREELAMAIDLSCGHLSLYQLTIEPGTPFFRDGIPAASEEHGAVLFEATLKMTADAGLHAYEISNHSKAGFESRHNLTYWEGGNYIGIGPGAHSRLSSLTDFKAIYQIYDPTRWLSAVEKNGHGTGKCLKLTHRDRAEEMIMTGLRLAKGLNTSRIELNTGLKFTQLVNKYKLTQLIKEGLLEKRGKHIAATQAGWLVLNSITQALLTETSL